MTVTQPSTGEDRDVQVPEQWSPGESQRAIQRLADSIDGLSKQVSGLPGQWQADLRDMRTELRGDYVRRDVYDERARTNDEWRRRVDARLAEFEADSERLREDQTKHIEHATKQASSYVSKDEVTRQRNYVLAAIGVAFAALGVVAPFVLFALDRLIAK